MPWHPGGVKRPAYPARSDRLAQAPTAPVRIWLEITDRATGTVTIAPAPPRRP